MTTPAVTGSTDVDPRDLPRGALQLLILQPTPFCNIDCDYCYLPNRDSTARMSDGVLRAALDRVFESGLAGEEFTVVWHAGEPLVLGVGWYENALRVIREHTPEGVRVRHSIQSNGMLIDDAWCAFLRANDNVEIGLSLDGPAALHDARRKTRSGKGTLAPALRGMRALRERGVDFHVISVLTAAALEYPDEMFEFYVENGVRRVGFNVEEVEGGHRASSLMARDVDRRFRLFLRRFMAMVERYDPEMEVREVSSAMAMLHAPPDEGRDHQNVPWAIVNVGVDGGFSTFSPELLGVASERWGDFTVGNVLRDSFADAARSERFRAMRAEIDAGVARCRASCRYYRVCGGGAPANKYFENGSFDSAETLHCRLSTQAVFDVCASVLNAPVAR